jgi:hypothetical protein
MLAESIPGLLKRLQIRALERDNTQVKLNESVVAYTKFMVFQTLVITGNIKPE